MRQPGLLLITILIGLNAGCAGPKTPSEVAQAFWAAVAGHDENAVRQLTTEASRGAVDLSKGRWRNARVTFGEIRIKNDDASIETRLTVPNQTGPAPIELSTVLKKENERWKVDYEQTMASLRARDALTDLLGELQNLGEQFSGTVDQTLSELQKELPKIEKDLKAIGDSMGQAVQETLQNLIPKLQDGIDTFAESLEKALEESMKKQQPEQKEDNGRANSI